MTNLLRVVVHSLSRVRFVAVSIIVFAALASAALVKVPSKVAPPQASAVQGQLAVAQVAFTIRGFEPAEMSLPHQDILLMLANKSGFINAKFQLHRDNGQKMIELPFLNLKRRARERLKLPPGRYLLTEASHPNWSCQITVTNQ
jgi:hypothetical protein